MARTARTHKETVRPDFIKTERPDPFEERTASEAGEGGPKRLIRSGHPKDKVRKPKSKQRSSTTMTSATKFPGMRGCKNQPPLRTWRRLTMARSLCSAA